MGTGIVTASYIIAAVLFILSLGGLSNPETARRGNAYGMAGMLIAIVSTVLGPEVTGGGMAILILVMLIGGSIGFIAAKRVQMTEMPELVAMLHSFVGLAAVLIGYATYVGGNGHRRGGHAGRGVDAEQLFRLGGGGDRLSLVERPPDRHRRAGGLVRRDPELHHVQGDEPQFISVILGGFGNTTAGPRWRSRANRSPSTPKAWRRR
jgi:NAD/NADP transhydrogenase beta subunit